MPDWNTNKQTDTCTRTINMGWTLPRTVLGKYISRDSLFQPCSHQFFWVSSPVDVGCIDEVTSPFHVPIYQCMWTRFVQLSGYILKVQKYNMNAISVLQKMRSKVYRRKTHTHTHTHSHTMEKWISYMYYISKTIILKYWRTHLVEVYSYTQDKKKKKVGLCKMF